jgi:transposase
VKHVQRAKIVLLSAARLPVLEIAKRVGISRPMVWRWQQRFAEEGIEGLLRDKTRPPGIPPVPQAKGHAVVERTLREPPGAVTHWTGRAMAKAMGLRCERSSAFGSPISSSRTGSGPSSDPRIPTSPPSLMMSLVST